MTNKKIIKDLNVDELQNLSAKTSEALRPIKRVVENINKATRIFADHMKAVTNALSLIKNINFNFNFDYIDKLAKTLKKYDELCKKIFLRTKDEEWFFNMRMMDEFEVDFDNRILQTKHSNFDEMIYRIHDTNINNIKDYICKHEADPNIKEYITELIYLYSNEKYFSCISTAQPLIEHVITRINLGNRITSSKAIRDLINKREAITMINNTMPELFETYYYCDDTKYDTKSKIPNRHFIAHGFGFDFVDKKGALNMIILLSILYDYSEIINKKTTK